MKQTAVEWLMQQLPTIDKYDPYYQDLFTQAKAMEKEQIFEAWDNGFANGYDLGKYNDECSPEDAEQYYTKTYESNN